MSQRPRLVHDQQYILESEEQIFFSHRARLAMARQERLITRVVNVDITPGAAVICHVVALNKENKFRDMREVIRNSRQVLEKRQCNKSGW